VQNITDRRSLSLEKIFFSQQNRIETWLQEQWRLSPAPVYGSVDLRNAGFKIAPIDMNLFPAGFNNLNPEFLDCSVEGAKKAILRAAPATKKILLIPENHTRNQFYWDNIAVLNKILSQAGFLTRMGSLLSEEAEKKADVHSVQRENNKIKVDDFIPDVILLNNDLSEGIPDILQGLTQPIMPPAELGWSRRLKSKHFHHYANVSQSFADMLGIDTWLIAPLFEYCGEVDFMRHEGEECLASHVDALLKTLQKKYDEYDIQHKPFVIVKADAGTYGMAVMTVRSADEVRHLNRKQRTSMAKSKGGQPVRQVIVQEGVYTFETVGPNNMVAEPVVYLWGEAVAGGFYRVHKERGTDESLNSPGMHFEPLPFAKPCHLPGEEESQNLFYVYGVIARLSMLAAAREML